MTRFILAICFGAGDLTGQFITYAVAGRVVVKIGVRVMLGRVCDPNAFPGYPYEIAEWLRSVVDRADCWTRIHDELLIQDGTGYLLIQDGTGYRHWVSPCHAVLTLVRLSTSVVLEYRNRGPAQTTPGFLTGRTFAAQAEETRLSSAYRNRTPHCKGS